MQRAAMLYGRYEPEPAVPDGTRAVIECVYEPPQKTDGVSVTLLEDPFEPTVQRVAGTPRSCTTAVRPCHGFAS